MAPTPGPDEVVAQICATFVWDQAESQYVRVAGCNNDHQHLKQVEFSRDDEVLNLRFLHHADEIDLAFNIDFISEIVTGLSLLESFQRDELLDYDGYFDRDLQAIHISIKLFTSVCDDQSPAHSLSYRRWQKELIEFIFPDNRSEFDLRSDCEADISAFLDSIKPPAVPEHGPVQGLVCNLLPFQSRALTWALNREQRTENKLDMMFEECHPGLYLNRSTGRMTTIRFLDEIRGGMLCQTMGLGKTVEQIAIILSNRPSQQWLRDGEFERRPATLVVCPQALLGQWQQEVVRHAPTLQVGIVFTQSDLHVLDDDMLDVVLASYEIIRQQYVCQQANEHRRTLRRGRSSIHPVPFLDVEWWRVVLDEAQRIVGESGVTRAAQSLKAELRWVVSGTPICRRLHDLSGLLRFFGLRSVGADRLRDVLSVLMYRHGKHCVEDELVIPQLTVETVYVQLSDIEHIKYSKMIRRCNTIKNMTGMKEETRTARLCRMLLLLRKICCCTFLVDGRRGDIVQASEALPIVEIKKRICHEADLEVDIAARTKLKSMTQMATAIALVDRDYDRAEALIVQAQRLAEDALQPFLTSEGDRDHRSGTKFDHARTLSGRAVVLECLGRVEDARAMLLDCHEIVDQYLSGQLQEMRPITMNESQQLEDVFNSCSGRFSLAVFRLMMGRDQAEAIADLRQIDTRLAQFLAEFDGEIAAAVAETDKVLAGLRGRLEIQLEVAMHRRTLFRDLMALRVSVLDCLLDLTTLSIIESADHHLKNRNACRQLLDSLPVDRDRTEVGFLPDCSDDDEDNDEEENFRRTTLGENRAGLRLDGEIVDYLILQGSIMTGLIRTTEKLHLDDVLVRSWTSRMSLISIVVGKEAAALSSRCSSWISAMFAVLRTRLYLRQMISNSDENDPAAGQCWERCFVIREELRNLYRRSFDQLETFFEEIRAQGQVPVLDLRRAEIELKRSEQELQARQNEHRYISQKFAAEVVDGDRIQSDDQICLICRAELQTPIVTPCGHIFCSSCLSSYMVSGHGLCPLRCHNRFQFKDCLLIDDSVPEPDRKRLKPAEVQSDYGAKISDLLRRLFEIRRQDPAAKSLIFSHWVDLLNVCRMALEEHGIACVQLRGDSRQKAKCIETFLNSPGITVFLIPMAQGASGLTMVAARHAFIMEPGLNATLEDQAINRIHRIGQQHATNVVKYIAKGTVEEPIVEIQERQRATGHQAQKAYTPEVFDESILNDIFR